MTNEQRGWHSGLADAPARPQRDADPADAELLERFTSRRDAAAFAALVRRHGPMVLSVCRRVLNQVQDAEDAFQATFLVLARRAGSLRQPELLGNWLYGVAYRTARKARAQTARRRRYERQAAAMATAEPNPEPLWQELRSVLDGELQRLPARYRAPLVLCYLEGLTNEEAARRLGWPAGSISYRLARGREMLRDRLRSRQEVFLPALVLVLLARHAAPASVPAHLLAATVQAATDLAGGASLLGTASAQMGDGAGGPPRAPRAVSWGRLTLRLAVALVALVAVAALTYVALGGSDFFFGGSPGSVGSAPGPAPQQSGPAAGDGPHSCH